jgi:cardiolipin synthase
MTLASLVTLVRLVLVPLFGAWLARGDPRALPLFAAIAAGDLLDGLLARTVSRPSRLGALLDAAADKALMIAAYVLGTAAGMLPVWLALVVVARDALQMGVWLALGVSRSRAQDPIRWEPSRVGKYATFAQAITVLFALRAALLDAEAPGPGPLLRSWMVLTAVLTLVSGIQYLLRAATQLRPGSAPQRGTR